MIAEEQFIGPNRHEPVEQQSNALWLFNCLKGLSPEALVQSILPFSVLHYH